MKAAAGWRCAKSLRSLKGGEARAGLLRGGVLTEEIDGALDTGAVVVFGHEGGVGGSQCAGRFGGESVGEIERGVDHPAFGEAGDQAQVMCFLWCKGSTGHQKFVGAVAADDFRQVSEVD